VNRISAQRTLGKKKNKKKMKRKKTEVGGNVLPTTARLKLEIYIAFWAISY
jgi:hypothetical protein